MRDTQIELFILCFLIAPMLGACTTQQNQVIQKDQSMITLGIDLQAGFEGDKVVIDINGKNYFKQDKVLTKLLLGYAETKVFQVPQGRTSIKVSLPQKRQAKTIELDLKKDTYLGISVTPGGIEIIVSEQPFFYQ